jgi:inorganic pyrophosphatase
MTRIDAGKKHHKILAVATQDPEFNGEAREMPHRLPMLRRFFQDSKQLEGKAVEVDEIRAAAAPIVNDAPTATTSSDAGASKESAGFTKHAQDSF